MLRKRAALELGLQLIQQKLGRAAGDPSFSVLNKTDSVEENQADLPTTAAQVRDRSAKIKPPRVISTR